MGTPRSISWPSPPTFADSATKRSGADVMYAAIDTGTTRNATVLVVGGPRVTHEHPAERPLWVITGLWRWQGRPGAPLSHEVKVGPEVWALLRARRIATLAADGIEYAGLFNAFKACGEKSIQEGRPHHVSIRIQGGELGPSPDGSSIGVYGHGKKLVQERRLKIEIEDEEEIERLVRGFQALQEEAGRVWLPEEGDDHHDSTSAVLRLLWHASAGLDRTPQNFADVNRRFPCYAADGSTPTEGEAAPRATWAPTW